LFWGEEVGRILNRTCLRRISLKPVKAKLNRLQYRLSRLENIEACRKRNISGIGAYTFVL